jgi:hypothetical protein
VRRKHDIRHKEKATWTIFGIIGIVLVIVSLAQERYWLVVFGGILAAGGFCRLALVRRNDAGY